jgi:hypothetical protein
MNLDMGERTAKEILGGPELMPLEVLNLSLMLFRSIAAIECAEVLPFSRVRIFLPRAQPVLT